MRQLLYVLLLPFLVLPFNGITQAYQYERGYGYANSLDGLTALANGNWLAICTSKPDTDINDIDTVFAIVFNQNLEIILHKPLQLDPPRLYSVEQVLATPDGGFVMRVKNGVCDAPTLYFSLVAFDSSGELKWKKDESSYRGAMYINPAGELLILNNDLNAYNSTTGEFLWSEYLIGPNFSLTDNFVTSSDENKIILIWYNYLEIWEKESGLGYFFKKQFKAIVPDQFKKLVKNTLNGMYYTYLDGKNTLYQIDIENDTMTVLADYPFRIIDLVARPSGLILLGGDTNQLYVLKLNFQGGVVDTVRTLPGHLEVNHLAYQTGNKLAIGGVNSHETYMYIRARQMWLHTNKLNDDPVVNVADVALMEVVPRAPVLIDTINATSLTPVLYSLSGGDFEARIFNNSAVVLKEVAICVSFDYIFKGCLERAQKKITYTGLHVAPGEATTLDFGNISAPKQWGLPSAMCFYTSSPNALPDDNPNNDKACYEIATVNTYAPEPDHLLIWPNPASTWIYIKLPCEELNNTHWKLLDNIGRVLQSGEIETGASILSINTVGIARGTYWVMINNRVAQVVIQ